MNEPVLDETSLANDTLALKNVPATTMTKRRRRRLIYSPRKTRTPRKPLAIEKTMVLTDTDEEAAKT